MAGRGRAAGLARNKLEADRNKIINIYNVDVTHQYNDKEALCTQQQDSLETSNKQVSSSSRE